MKISTCPKCGRLPEIEKCEPWPKDAGPQPWYAMCNQPNDHYLGVNGDDRADTIREWNLAVDKDGVPDMHMVVDES